MRLRLICALAVISLAIIYTYEFRTRDKFERACDAAGGRMFVIKSNSRLVCVRPGYEIYIKDDSK